MGLYIARASKRVETRGGRIGLTRANRSAPSSSSSTSSSSLKLAAAILAACPRDEEACTASHATTRVARTSGIPSSYSVKSREEARGLGKHRGFSSRRKDGNSSGRFSPSICRLPGSLAAEKSAKFPRKTIVKDDEIDEEC